MFELFYFKRKYLLHRIIFFLTSLYWIVKIDLRCALQNEFIHIILCLSSKLQI